MIEMDGGIIPEKNALGEEKFWQDIGRPGNDGWALALFKEECCENCSCKD